MGVVKKLNLTVKEIAGFLTALGVVVSSIVVCYNFIAERIESAIDQKVGAVNAELVAHHKVQDQQITRLDLSDLIRNQPRNKAAIEKLARYYFVDLDGDTWMTDFYSQWAEEYGGDISFVLGGK